MEEQQEAIRWNEVADLYDSFVQATFDLPFWLEEAGKAGGEILELMCGTGRVSLPLLEAGARLTCVDNAPEMLARLQDKLRGRELSATVCQMDVRELSLPRHYDLAIVPFHAFAELTSPDDQRRTLSGIHRHLTGTGRLILTLHNPPVRLQSVDGVMRLWANYPLTENGEKRLLWGAETRGPETGVVTGIETFEIYDSRGQMLSRRMLEFRFRLLERHRFEALAEEAGFAVEALYGDYAYGAFQEECSRFLIYVLRKKG
ncbi:MAG TPA: class I SAM-dependent methyltransferase [Symbiobacteriaceae bacterium]|nr:class I SAM-dependent methyltransferase [Symbiobacteriaceae bacterium]